MEGKRNVRDARYEVIKLLIEAGKITSIREIFIYIPKTTVYKDLGINFNRFDRAIVDPSIFKLAELRKLAEMFEVDARRIIDMAYEQFMSIKKGKK